MFFPVFFWIVSLVALIASPALASLESERWRDISRQTTDTTCGPAVVANLLTRSLGDPTPEGRVAELLSAVERGAVVPARGSTLLGLRSALARLGYKSYGLRLPSHGLERYLQRERLPLIIHLASPTPHFSLAVGRAYGHVILADPSIGLTALPHDLLARHWDGAALAVLPHPGREPSAWATTLTERAAGRLRLLRLASTQQGAPDILPAGAGEPGTLTLDLDLIHSHLHRRSIEFGWAREVEAIETSRVGRLAVQYGLRSGLTLGVSAALTSRRQEERERVWTWYGPHSERRGTVSLALTPEGHLSFGHSWGTWNVAAALRTGSEQSALRLGVERMVDPVTLRAAVEHLWPEDRGAARVEVGAEVAFNPLIALGLSIGSDVHLEQGTGFWRASAAFVPDAQHAWRIWIESPLLGWDRPLTVGVGHSWGLGR